MATILYGVAGEGLGHAMRSKVVLDFLAKRHTVKVVAAERGYQYLSANFNTEEIDYFKIIYRNNKAAHVLTFFNNLFRLPFLILKAAKVFKIIKELKPDIIITDFEPLTAYAAWVKGIPLISIDNQHSVGWTDAPIPKKGWDKFAMDIVMRLFIPKANHYFITSFFPAKCKKKNTTVINPLIREKIRKLHSKKGSHVLVYQTSASNKKLLPALKNINRKFIVYGFGKTAKKGNVQFKKFHDPSFYRDFAHCEAVITNGGFTLMSEALYLRKPVLSIPVAGQYEQLCNAHLLHSTYGMEGSTTSKDIKEFLSALPALRNKLSSYTKYSNKNSLQKIEQKLKSIA